MHWKRTILTSFATCRRFLRHCAPSTCKCARHLGPPQAAIGRSVITYIYITRCSDKEVRCVCRQAASEGCHFHTPLLDPPDPRKTQTICIFLWVCRKGGKWRFGCKSCFAHLRIECPGHKHAEEFQMARIFQIGSASGMPWQLSTIHIVSYSILDLSLTLKHRCTIA